MLHMILPRRIPSRSRLVNTIVGSREADEKRVTVKGEGKS
jgi:hypothetical protein